MKKFLSMAFALAMALPLAACGGGDTGNAGNNNAGNSNPSGGGIQLQLTSPVIHRFGNHMRSVILETLERLDIKDAVVTVVDKGALDCTLKARVEGAAFRAAQRSEEPIPWGGAVR